MNLKTDLLRLKKTVLADLSQCLKCQVKTAITKNEMIPAISATHAINYLNSPITIPK